MSELSRKRLLTRIKRAWIKQGWIEDDSGVAALVIAAVIAVVAFTALSIFLNKFIGGRELARVQSGSSAQGQVTSALFAYYYGQTPTHTLPCPDTKTTSDGTADSTCSSGATRGVLPWKTLGLSQDAVVDSYGNYFTYVVSAAAKNMCTSIGNDLNSAIAAEYTGSLISATDLTLSAPEGSRNVAFAIIGHGPNKAGAKTESGTSTTTPTNTDELANSHTGSAATIHADTYEKDVFDDVVSAPTNVDLEKVCKSLTPGSALNATIGENFEGASTALPTAFAASATTPPTKVRTSSNNGVARFTAATSYLATASSYVISPVVRPVYVAAKWVPNADSAATSAGMSIATRATSSDLTSGSDIFAASNARGITFRFYDSAVANNAGAANHLYICDSATSACTSSTNLGYSASTFNLISGKTYLIEAFDDGTNLWMRITQDDDATNAAYARATTTASNDSGGSQSIIFINDIHSSSSVNYLDEVSVGVPMLALETDGNDDVVFSAAASNVLSGGGPYSLTLEAWVRPRALPTGNAAIISRWDANSGTAAGNQGYRLYMDSTGTLNLSISGNVGINAVTRSIGLGIQPETQEWTHVAVVFDAAAKTVTSYKNGVRASVGSTDIDSGVNAESAHPFSVGAEYNGATIVDEFTGDISDVRVWKAARTTADIRTCYEIRLPTTACPTTNLVVNWTLDPGIGGLQSSTAAATVGTAGTVTNALFVPALAVYFRPFSTEVCPSNKAGPYECDFRPTSATVAATSVDIDIPDNLSAVYAKVWGGGGGGYSFGGHTRSGGNGGYSAGLIQTIGTSIAGMNITILAGGGGTGSTTEAMGAGGGAGSLIQNLAGTTISLIAGGGGGGSYSNDAPAVCNGASDLCGQGADGGGASVTTSTALDGTSTCGGRGGDNSPSGNNPPTSGGDCPDAGADPTGSTTTGGRGGAGTSGAAGGGGTAGTNDVSGGRGYQPADTSGSPGANAVGAGGGGGGYIGGEAGGQDDSQATTGYGGGGGSGHANGVSNVVTASAFSDSACTGNLTNNNTTVTVTSCTSGVLDLVSRGWTAGMSVTVSAGIPANTTLVSVSTTTFVMSAQATNGSSKVLTVTGSGSSSGTSDSDYSPSTLPAAYASPGLAGSSGGAGHAGAVILFW